MDKHYLYLNKETGLMEAVDIETGVVVPMEVRRQDLAKYRVETHEGQRRWVPLVDLASPKTFSVLIADQICMDLLEGKGIRKAAENVGITYREYVLWRRTYPEFAEMVDEARRDRAELIFEKLEAIAENTEEDEDAIALGRLKADVYKHISEVLDSGRFGKKTQITAKIGVGRIEIETGIRRPGDTGFQAAGTFKEVEEQQKRIEQADLNVIPISSPSNLPKKVDEL